MLADSEKAQGAFTLTYFVLRQLQFKYLNLCSSGSADSTDIKLLHMEWRVVLIYSRKTGGKPY